jgi:NTE family protein
MRKAERWFEVPANEPIAMANALILGGGAPTLTLEAGALTALLDHEVEFDVVSTAGAGMLVGLLYAAPKGIGRREALIATKELGVHDSLYDVFPINFKVFLKPGQAAASYRRWQESLAKLGVGQMGRLAQDFWALQFAAWCPSDLTSDSLGMCAAAPWIEHAVDFERLQSFRPEFYLNAYCIEDEAMRIFAKHEITADHFRAGLAFPLIYPPFELEGKTYIEGSAVDTMNFRGLLRYREARAERAALPPLRNVVIFDVLSAKKLIRTPRNLYDAWVLSIIVPLVELARHDIELFRIKYNTQWKLNLLKIEFDIPDERWPYVLDWSYSNLSALWDIGYAAGARFCDRYQAELAGEY